MNLDDIPYRINDCCGIAKTRIFVKGNLQLVITEHDDSYQAIELENGLAKQDSRRSALSKADAETLCDAFLANSTNS